MFWCSIFCKNQCKHWKSYRNISDKKFFISTLSFTGFRNFNFPGMTYLATVCGVNKATLFFSIETVHNFWWQNDHISYIKNHFTNFVSFNGIYWFKTFNLKKILQISYKSHANSPSIINLYFLSNQKKNYVFSPNQKIS